MVAHGEQGSGGEDHGESSRSSPVCRSQRSGDRATRRHHHRRHRRRKRRAHWGVVIVAGMCTRESGLLVREVEACIRGAEQVISK